jgi:nucleoside-diphosphate-sugar epimerase
MPSGKMKVVVIGGTGHIASHLVPMLAAEQIEVVVIARGKTQPAAEHGSDRVRTVQGEYRANDPQWSAVLREAADNADTVIDLLGVDLAATFETVTDRCGHVIACGSTWMLGMPRRVPCPAVPQGQAFGEAYQRRWEVIQRLLAASGRTGPSFTAILPPNICGPGKIPLETRGGRSIDVHRELSRGAPVKLPAGADALLGPCDAEDVARGFFLALTQVARAAGRAFSVGSAHALTSSEFVAVYAELYGVRIPIERIPWEPFCRDVAPDPGARFHFEAHMCPDISEARQVLGYEPRFTPAQTMRRAVDWMRQRNLI